MRQPHGVWLLAAAVCWLAGVSGAPRQEPAESNGASDGDFERACLAAHNRHRRRHGAPALRLDPKLSEFAAKRAAHMAATDDFSHAKDLDFGENLAWHSNAGRSCAQLVQMWYDEIKLYDYDAPKFDASTGHFTQLVWRDTARLGCARANSRAGRGGVYLVCNYDPPGNFLGEFQDNVARKSPKSRARGMGPPTATSTSTTSTTTTTTTTTPAPRVAATVKPAPQPTTPTSSPTSGPSSTTKKPKRKKPKSKKKPKKPKGSTTTSTTTTQSPLDSTTKRAG